jgi:Transposase DDE domain
MIDITALYVEVDDFCKYFLREIQYRFIECGIKKRNRAHLMTPSEVVTILIYFHYSGFKNFKAYYLFFIKHTMREYFPVCLSYQRFIAIIKEYMFLVNTFMQYKLTSANNGIGFVDSTSIAVCSHKRTSNHKVFDGFAAIGKTTKGWFYGFKLHVICSLDGEIIDVRFTPGEANDLKTLLKMKRYTGKLFGDKGYIGKEGANKLLERGILLLTGLRKNMKNKLLSVWDKVMLKKRSLIESIFNIMKNSMMLEHSRHRSVINAFIHMVCVVIAYCYKPDKPKIKLTTQELRLLEEL